MLNTEGQWSEALASNNIRAIIRWLNKITAEGTKGSGTKICEKPLVYKSSVDSFIIIFPIR